MRATEDTYEPLYDLEGQLLGWTGYMSLTITREDVREAEWNGDRNWVEDAISRHIWRIHNIGGIATDVEACHYPKYQESVYHYMWFTKKRPNNDTLRSPGSEQSGYVPTPPCG